MARYLDISVPVGAETIVYPGDPPTQLSWPCWSHEQGDAVNLGVFQGTLHCGTHVDAPWHVVPGAKRLDSIPLDRWVGPCWVADLTDQPRNVTAPSLQAAGIPAGTRRLLLKTRNSLTDYWREAWNPEFVYLDPSAAQWCLDHGVWTLGYDYLSIDPPDGPNLPAHALLLGREVALIENLALRDVEPGPYELIAAPIKLIGVDGAWCRALLRTES